MKKNYLAPAIEVLYIALEESVLSTSEITSDPHIDDVEFGGSIF